MIGWRVPILAMIVIFAAASAKAGPTPRPGDLFRDCGQCGEMVVIPAGSNVFGSTEAERRHEGVPPMFAVHEGPQIRVTIARPFAIAKTEVTRGQYAAFVADTGRPDPIECGIHDARTDSWAARPGYNWHNPGFAQGDDHPVVCVSWIDATAYAAWLAKKTGKAYRLPSEEEWEYAARGGTITARPWGDNAADTCLNANIATVDTVAALNSTSWEDKLACTSKHSFTTPVGSFDPNPYGVQDMIGNAWEWTADCYRTDYRGANTDGAAWITPDCPTRVARGGAFHSQIWLARVAIRGEDLRPDNHNFAIGFRVARDLN